VASVKAQVLIGGNGTTDTPHEGAILDLSKTTGKGLLLPKVNLGGLTDFSVADESLQGAGKGMMVYNTNEALGLGVYVWDGSAWRTINECTAASEVTITGNTVASPGGDIVLTAASNGTNPVYTWYKESVDESNIAGTGNVLTLTDVQLSDAGKYICRVETECNSTTPIDKPVNVGVIDLSNPPAIPSQLTVSFTGENCFDIAMTQPAGCDVALVDRASGKTDFSLGVRTVYAFHASAAVSNIRFVYANSNGEVIVAGQPSAQDAGQDASFAVDFDTNLNVTAAGTVDSNALTAYIIVTFDYQGTTYSKRIDIKVKDCSCCPGVKGLDGKCYYVAAACLSGDTSTAVNTVIYRIPGVALYAKYGSFIVYKSVVSAGYSACVPSMPASTSTYDVFNDSNIGSTTETCIPGAPAVCTAQQCNKAKTAKLICSSSRY
jgi:hypothetical protein